MDSAMETEYRDFTFADYGLPDNYGKLTAKARREARIASLTSWFDPDKPAELVADVGKFVKACRLWRDFYLKASPCNAGKYDMRDPLFKWEMVRQCFQPANLPEEPAKAVVKSSRYATKTVTLIHEVCSMILVCRPNTRIVVSEANKERTQDEVIETRRQIEECVMIHADFGGEGRLFRVTGKGSRWNDNFFILQNGSQLKGISANAAHRGRHPHLIIVDDPEKDEKKSSNPLWRKQYFDWLFRQMLGMLRRGNVIIWIGTDVGLNSCLGIAMKQHHTVPEDEGFDLRAIDQRFNDWHRAAFDIIGSDDDGNPISLFPDLLSAQGFEEKCGAIGRDAAMAEIRGDPIRSGELVLRRHEFRHGYMHCEPNKRVCGEHEYMLDLKTGETMAWRPWLDSLEAYQANDIADSLEASACPCACVTTGVDADGNYFVLDIWQKRALVDEHVPTAFQLARRWKAVCMGWEKAGLQDMVRRWALRIMNAQRAAGNVVPNQVPIPNLPGTVQRKELRIIAAISHVLDHDLIRFLRLQPVVSGSITHVPVRQDHRLYHLDLLDAVDTMTENGCRGDIDGLDALEMCLRIIGERKSPNKPVEEHPTDSILTRWKEIGLDFEPALIPSEAWSPAMLKEHNRLEREELSVSSPGPDPLWNDLYD